MRLLRRRHGSQRGMAPVKLTFQMEDDNCLVFKGEDGIWYMIEAETLEDVRVLMSQAHILHHNYRD